MPLKKRKGLRTSDSIQGNSVAKNQLLWIFENDTITANSTFDDIYVEQPTFQVVQREKFRCFYNTHKRIKITRSN